MTLYGLLSAIIDKVNKSIKTDSQNLSDTEKAQARANIDAAKSDILICNPNLLDNWYFGNPVNQQNITSWSTGYGIDKWRISTGATAQVLSDSLLFTGSAQYQNLEQSINNFTNLLGKTVTLSVLFKETVPDITFTTGFLFGSSFYQEFTSGDLYSVTYTVPLDATLMVVFVQDTVGSKSCNISAIKLELGDKQTLAHQDSNGNWVLNEIPNYAEELLKCRQHDLYTGEYIGLRKFSQPRNLLDNSDFRNLVNQRGFVSGSSATVGQWVLDRWQAYEDITSLTFSNDGLLISNSLLYQRLNTLHFLVGKKITIAVYFADGSISLKTGTVVNNSSWTDIAETDDRAIKFVSWYTDMWWLGVSPVAGKIIRGVALYEGEYTADTLPEYQPKGYARELAECQRYFQRFQNSHETSNFMLASGQATTSTRAFFAIYLPVPMRIYPTITVSDVSSIILSNDGQQTTCVATSVNSAGGLGSNEQNFSQRSFSVVTSGLTAKSGYIVYVKSGGYIDFSADL